MRIFLIGFMGSGKTYIGRLLAEKLGLLSLDIDHLIENTEGVKISQIFDNQGEIYFRKIECEMLRSVSKWQDIVISTGGGTACHHDNMAYMNDNGITIYLKASPEFLSKRLQSESENRPILQHKTAENLLEFIADTLEKRRVFYEQADIIIEQTDNENVLQQVIEALYARVKS